MQYLMLNQQKSPILTTVNGVLTKYKTVIEFAAPIQKDIDDARYFLGFICLLGNAPATIF